MGQSPAFWRYKKVHTGRINKTEGYNADVSKKVYQNKVQNLIVLQHSVYNV
jgi:hypothetical protein